MPAREYRTIGDLVVCTKVNGQARTPTINASEKFNVASVASDIPKKSNENDFIS